MLGEEALRLLREKWPTATMLAEELYVLLSSPDIPITTSAPIVFTKPAAGASEAPLQFQGYGPADPVIQINRPNGAPITISGDGINLGGATITGGGINFPGLGTTELDGVPDNVEGQPLNGPIPGTGGQGGGQPAPASASTFPGVVVSGTGSTYVMVVYPGGLSGPPQTATATQLQIDPTQTIPPGSWGLVSLAGDNYYVQFPVWL